MEMLGQPDIQLFMALARTAEQHMMCGFAAQGLSNMAWAFAKVAPVGQPDVQLFRALARMIERRMGEFDAQGLANTA